MKCLDCGKLCLNFNKYIMHITYFHNKNNYFMCPINNCRRLYSNKADLKKHVERKHNAPSSFFETRGTQKQSERVNYLAQNSCNSNDKHEILQNSNNSESITEGTNIEKIKKNLTEVRTLLSNVLPLFISKFYENLKLNRSMIQMIIIELEVFLHSGFIQIVKESIKSVCDAVIDKNVVTDICKMLDIIENSFTTINTEYKRIQFFTKTDYFIKPVQNIIGVSCDNEKKNGETILRLKDNISYYIPIGLSLKQFLELPDVFNTIINYQDQLLKNYNYDGSEPLYNIVNGSLWEKVCCKTKQILPLILLYFDELETGNALGSHAGCYKLGAVYFSIATIPPIFATRLENIFLCYLFHSSDRVTFGNRAVFQVLLNQIKTLE